MAASSSGSRTYDVFPSFRGEDVRDSFLSHLLKALKGKSISTFIDNGIERSCEIGHALLSAIRGAKISIVIFSKNYASSKWCLDELVEIHKCYKRSHQKVIPIFYNVDPSEVRKQTGEIKKVFEETCKDKSEVWKNKWKEALTCVANLAGEHLKKGVDEARVVEKIANDVSEKLIISPSNYSDGLVGIEAHIEAMKSRLCLESEEVRMVGIVGASGIGKSTIGRELYTQISKQFPYHVYATYIKTNQDNCTMKLDWAKKFLWEILGQKDIKVLGLGEVKQRLKDKKVLIILDDVDNLELLETLVGNTDWFGPGSRIIVITQDKHLLKAHDIDHIYEVEFPTETLALEMLCYSAFKQNSPPDGFMQVTIEVVELAGNLPLGLSVLGSSLRRRSKDEWMEMLPRLQNILDGDIGKRLRVSYDRLNKEDQLLFLYIACHFSGKLVHDIRESLGLSDNFGLRMLAEKSLVRITKHYETEVVEMHDLLKKLGREIVCAESSDPGKRRFLVDVDDIRQVLTNNTGTDTVHGIIYDILGVTETISVHKKSFESMCNIQILKFCSPWHNKDKSFMDFPQGLVSSLPRQLRVLHWDNYPAKCLPSTFEAEFLVRLIMQRSKLEKLWEGTPPLKNLKVMDMSESEYLEVIPDLSKAINLEELRLYYCTSLVTLHSSIQNLTKLFILDMEGCTKLENIPTLLNLESLEFFNVYDCQQLINFPMINLDNSDIKVESSSWSSNLPRLVFLDCLMRFLPRQYGPEHFRSISMCNSKIEKLWEGVQCFVTLEEIDLSDCENLKEIPDLSKATNLRTLKFVQCRSLLMVPSTIGNLQSLEELHISDCLELEILPIDVNLSSLRILDFNGCSGLSMFPKISSSVEELYINETAIEGVPCFIEDFSSLRILKMRGCTRLKVLPIDVNLSSLRILDFSGCSGLSMFPKFSSSVEELYLNETAIEGVPCFIEDFSSLKILKMHGCTRLKVLPIDVNLSSLRILDFNGCSRLSMFPKISSSVEELYLNETAIDGVPCFIEDFSSLKIIKMRSCKRLKNISSKIFRLSNLETVDFADCENVMTVLSNVSAVTTTEDNFGVNYNFGRISDSLGWSYDGHFGRAKKILDTNSDEYFNFENCFKLGEDVREFIIQSCFKPTVLPGREVPTYFKHRAFGNSLIVTLPQIVFPQDILQCKACVVFEAPFECSSGFYLNLNYHFNSIFYKDYSYWYTMSSCETDHLFLCSFEFQPNILSSKFEFDDVEFTFRSIKRIKECGVRFLNVSISPGGSDGSYETTYNQQSRDICEVVETRGSKKRRSDLIYFY